MRFCNQDGATGSDVLTHPASTGTATPHTHTEQPTGEGWVEVVTLLARQVWCVMSGV